jgi:FdhD protein
MLDGGLLPVDLQSVQPDGRITGKSRPLAIEAPIAIEYNGLGYAVMMATPIDLHDFAVGFSLSEKVIGTPSEIVDIDVFESANGWFVRVQVDPGRMDPIFERARQRVSEGSCGLCGLENLEQVMRPLAPISAPVGANTGAIFAALANLDGRQPLNRATGAAHGAAFCTNTGDVTLVREDVGRHNALDKLIGALARQGVDPATGLFLLTARCSYELVEKTIISGCPLLVTISAPTTLAVERAKAHGLTLVSLARPDAMLLVAGSLATS